MDKLIGVCALAVSLSAFGQGDPQDSRQDQQYPQQMEQQQDDTSYDQGSSQDPSMTQEQDAYDDTTTDDTTSQPDTMQNDDGHSGMSADATSSSSDTLNQLAREHDLNTFVQALEETGLADSVAQGDYTVFAPTDAAFEASGKDLEELRKPENREQLIALLRNHLVADQVDADEAKTLDHAMTVEGGTLDLAETNGELTVNGAKVTETDIHSGNLIVHTIDQVLEPREDSVAAQTQEPRVSEDDDSSQVAQEDDSIDYGDAPEEGESN